MALSLVIASAAAAATQSLNGGETELALRQGFMQKLSNNGVKVQKTGLGKVSGGSVMLPISSGDFDSSNATGTIRHEGGFRFKRGKRKAKVSNVQITLGTRSVTAKVAGKQMKLGSLTPFSISRQGEIIDLSSSKLKLTGAAAKQLNKKLALRRVFHGGLPMSESDSVSKLAAAKVVPVVTPPASEEAAPKNPVNVKVMTRNLYLGADLGPAIGTKTPAALFEAAGTILEEVEHNNFPVRAKGLAQEILTEKPDVVGLQEAALWRTQPVNLEVLSKGPSATTVKYDYLAELMAELNKEGQNYEVVVSQNEFDFESPADTDNPRDGNPNINGRLTMRDVILARSNAGITASEVGAGHFAVLLPVPVLSSSLPVARGWTEADFSINGGEKFHFVNTHLEAFEAHVRAAQAAQLIEPPEGALISDLPTILVGDLNSDEQTSTGADKQAYEILTHAGLVERSTNNPMSCCINSSELGIGDGGSESDFDHHIDHVMTYDPANVLLKESGVTGRAPVNGFWDSDHAGVWSSLEILP